MQCSIRNQCSGLFTCIIDYLYVLCMILMVLSCVLCMTLMVFIYVYYELFVCTNLVDVMSLFFTVFSFHVQNFGKNRLVSGKNRPELDTSVFGKTRKPADLSVKPATFPGFHCSSVISGAFRPNFPNFHHFLPNFSKTDGIGEVRFSFFRRIFEHWG
jgi:hypothetical protein